MQRAPVVLICPDSFKESLTAYQAAQAMQAGVLAVLPQAECLCLPLADGGEGTLAVLAEAWSLQTLRHTVSGPLGAPVTATWGIVTHPDGKRIGVIEMAAASGLMLLAPAQRNPLQTSSYGFGQLMMCALMAGVDELLLTIGGSATHDGGLGMLCALGARALDQHGQPVAATGAGLLQVHKLDMSGLDPRWTRMPIRVICDVKNPLCGEQGAARVFAAQKGADGHQIEQLERASLHWAALLANTLGERVDALPGAGAAGGVGAALLGCLRASLLPGIEVVLDLLGFDQLLARADLVLTGEGRLDTQTAAGKVISGVGARCKRQNKPLVALVGSLVSETATTLPAGVTACFATNPIPHSLDAALSTAAANLELTSAQVVALWASSFLKQG